VSAAPETVEAPSAVDPAASFPIESAPPTTSARSVIPAAERRSTAAPAPARRGAQRRAPTITINYGYLRHDLRTLAVLAPLMVVLLIVAFAVLHNA
jgi:hypothetical protein